MDSTSKATLCYGVQAKITRIPKTKAGLKDEDTEN